MCEKLAVDTKKTRQKKFDKKIKFYNFNVL